MTYLEMVKAAKKNGTFAEKQMWDSVESVSELLDDIKESHPERYWQFLREQAGIMLGCHYDKEWADYDVSQITYTDKDGKKHMGAYWTCEQIEEATKGMTFPTGVTKYDRYVAMNLAYSDFCKKFDDEQILKIGHAFFFADEDWSPKGSATKVWEYVECKNK